MKKSLYAGIMLLFICASAQAAQSIWGAPHATPGLTNRLPTDTSSSSGPGQINPGDILGLTSGDVAINSTTGAATINSIKGVAITTPTGTGAPVLATGPTISNPIITGSLTGSLTGNATTATTLQTPRTINAVTFDGSGNITVPAAAGTLTGGSLASGVTASSLTSVGTLGSLTVTAPITGSVTGNAGTATVLATGRTINGVNFDGSGNITVPAAAGTLTGSGLNSTVTASSLTSVGVLGGLTVTAPISGSITGNSATATAFQTARSINGVNFDGTAPITVTSAANTLSGSTLAPGVTASSLTSVGTLGNLAVTNPITGSVSGNAATATALQTARSINGVFFDGTANVTIPAGTVDLTTGVAGILPQPNGGTGTSNTGLFYTSMAIGNTAAQNMTALAADVPAAIAANKTLKIPAGFYKWGTSTQNIIDISNSGTANVNIDCEPGATFMVEAGYTSVPVVFTTQAAWVDAVVTGVNTVTSGGNISTNTEVTKVTLSSSPNAGIVAGDQVSLFSNDILPYNDGDSANFSHEIATVLSVSGNDIYLDRKLNRTYTVANYVRLRWYNNTGVHFSMNCAFDTDGNTLDNTITSRPAEVMELRGLRNLHVKNQYKALWAGGTRYNSSMDHDIQNDGSYLVNNGLSGLTVLGYIEDFDGPNRTAKIRGGIYERGRHITSTWKEQNGLTLSGAATPGSTTVFTYSPDATSSANTPAVGNFAYFTGVSGTLGTSINSTWQTITAKTGTIGAGGTITVSFNSTGLTGSAGAVQLYDPTQAYRYGEDDGREMVDNTCLGSLGDCDDEHNGSINKRTNGLTARYPVEYTWSGINPRALQIRGAGTMFENIYQERGNEFVNWYSASQNHGVDNYAYLFNTHLRDQQDKASGAPYFLTLGSSTVTDRRVMTVNNPYVDDGAYRVFSHANFSGDQLVDNYLFQGDWGVSSPTQYMMENMGGDLTFKGGVIDLTNAQTTTEILLAQAQGGRLIFDGAYIKSTCDTSNFPFSVNTGTATLIIQNSVIEFPSSATNGTCHLVQVNNVAANVIFNSDIFVNAAKLSTSTGLVQSTGSSGVATVTLNGIMSDAAMRQTSTAASGSAAVGTSGETLATNLKVVPGGAVRTGTNVGDTALLQAENTTGSTYTTFGTLTAGTTPTFDLSSTVTKAGQVIATAANNLSFFASTTSAQLAALISDETGSGLAVFNNGSTLNNTTLTGTTLANITGNASTATALGTAGTVTTVLHGNASGAPSYGAVNVATDITGITTKTNGGTGNAFGVGVSQGDMVWVMSGARGRGINGTGGTKTTAAASPTTTGTITSGSSSFTVSSATGIVNGMLAGVTAGSIPAGTTATISGTTVTLSQNTTASIASGTTIYFGNPTAGVTTQTIWWAPANEPVFATRILIPNFDLLGTGETDRPAAEVFSQVTASLNYQMIGTPRSYTFYGAIQNAIKSPQSPDPHGFLISDPLNYPIAANNSFAIRVGSPILPTFAYSDADYQNPGGGSVSDTRLNPAPATPGGSGITNFKEFDNIVPSGYTDQTTVNTNLSSTGGYSLSPLIEELIHRPASATITFGDSLAQGQNFYTADNLGNYGWIPQQLRNACLFGQLSRGTMQAAQFNSISNSQGILSLIIGHQLYVTDVLMLLGRNDLAAGHSAATIQADVAAASLPYQQQGIAVSVQTIPPTTASQDAWATTANQFYIYAQGTTSGSVGSSASTFTLTGSAPVGFTNGMLIATQYGTSIAPGTTATISGSTVTLSSPTTGTITAGNSIQFGNSTPNTQATVAIAYNAALRTGYNNPSYNNNGSIFQNLLDDANVVGVVSGSDYKWANASSTPLTGDGIHMNQAGGTQLDNSNTITCSMLGNAH